VQEIKEASEIACLCGMGPGQFAYTLANCTVGVYKGRCRLWRVKSKNMVHCICAYDFTGNGTMQLVSGWSNGKV
jgi:hypothetical protein